MAKVRTRAVRLSNGKPVKGATKGDASGAVTFQNVGGAGEVYIGVNSKTEGYRIRSGRAVTLDVGKGDEVWLWAHGGDARVIAGPPWRG